MVGVRTALISYIGAPFRILAFGLLRAVSERTDIHGVEIINGSRANQDVVFQKIKAVLEQMQQVDPLSFSRVRRYLRRIVVSDVIGPEYVHSAQACFIKLVNLQQESAERIALMVIHESVHARLRRMGIGYSSLARDRIERLCVSAELSFARRLPSGEALVDAIGLKLKEPWWTDNELSRRRFEELSALGWPTWLIRLRQLLFE